MKNFENLNTIVARLRESQGESFSCDEENLYSSFQKGSQEGSFGLKILSLLGGLLATVTFLGFLAISGMFESQMTIFILGLIFVGIAISVSATKDNVLLETSLISFYIAGVCMMVFGSFEFNLDVPAICFFLIILSILTCYFTQKFLLSFLSLSLFFGSLFVLMVLEYDPTMVHLFNAFVVFLYLYISLNEGKVVALHPIFNRLFAPLRIVLVLALLYGVQMTFPSMLYYNYVSQASISSIPIIIAVLILIYPLSKKLEVSSPKGLAFTYCFVVPFLLLTYSSSGISASLLILLIGFYTNHKTGFAIGVLGFLYFISRFYYDLNLDLLTKSGLLMACGLIFVFVYLFTRKSLSPNEKV